MQLYYSNSWRPTVETSKSAAGLYHGQFLERATSAPGGEGASGALLLLAMSDSMVDIVRFVPVVGVVDSQSKKGVDGPEVENECRTKELYECINTN
jgi:hypothetical protein